MARQNAFQVGELEVVCFIMFACHTVLLASIVIAVEANHRRQQKRKVQDWYCRMMYRSEN